MAPKVGPETLEVVEQACILTQGAVVQMYTCENIA